MRIFLSIKIARPLTMICMDKEEISSQNNKPEYRHPWLKQNQSSNYTYPTICIQQCLHQHAIIQMKNYAAHIRTLVPENHDLIIPCPIAVCQGLPSRSISAHYTIMWVHRNHRQTQQVKAACIHAAIGDTHWHPLQLMEEHHCNPSLTIQTADAQYRNVRAIVAQCFLCACAYEWRYGLQFVTTHPHQAQKSHNTTAPTG